MSCKIEEFVPLEAGTVKIYTCGPSIYLAPHIGNYRTFLFEDILQRYLEYSGHRVVRALNITDLEDKAIAQAKKEGIPLKEMTDRNTKAFLSELMELGAEMPTFVPRASECVDQAVALIKILLEKGYAYWYKGDVYYDPLKFEGFGELAHIDMGKWPKKRRRFHKDTYPGDWWNKGDFILWRGHREGEEVYWDTELGKGRPAWNVQDPAMCTKYLGYKIDIYCGGIDNLVRHHDYNRAVVEGVTGEEFSRYWLHGAHLIVNGKKMSKSKGNIIYPKDLLGMGYDWGAIRFFLIYGYYRKRLNFKVDSFDRAFDRLQKLRDMVKRLEKNKGSDSPDPRAGKLVERMHENFRKKMDDDLHVKAAFDAVFEAVAKLISMEDRGMLGMTDSGRALEALKAIDGVLRSIF